MAFGKSLELAKIQPPPARLFWNSHRYGQYMRPETRAAREAQLARFKAEYERKKLMREQKGIMDVGGTFAPAGG